MKMPALRLVLVASAAPFLPAAEVGPGATLEEVRAVLGAPNGQMQLNGRQVLYYERGAVELQGGRVTQVTLRSPEEHAALTARAERMRAEREDQRARLVVEGTALRDRKLADPAFQAAPLAYQISFWESFAQSYPGVSCLEPLTLARLRLNEKGEEQRRRDQEAGRLAELEQRLAAAERRPEFYPIRTYSSYHGRWHRHQEFGLGPITYRFYDAPLPVYVTPTTPLVTPFSGDLAQPVRRDYTGPGRDRGQWDDRNDRGDWRRADRGHDHRRNRM